MLVLLTRILFPTRGRRLLNGDVRTMPVRPLGELIAIRREYGTAFLAAMAEAINAEEYLMLESIYE
jgi:hypothetical protein